MTLGEIIVQLELSDHGSMALDHEIWACVAGDAASALEIPPPYTVSIDAALRLIPKSCTWTMESDSCWVRWMTDLDVDETQACFPGRSGRATALAVCLAALRAQFLYAEAAST